MQSSTAIAIRALIMLIVLISVPLFAIFGKNLPDVVKGLLEGRGLVLAPATASGTNSPSIGAPIAGSSPAANGPLGQSGPYRAMTDPNSPASTATAPLPVAGSGASGRSLSVASGAPLAASGIPTNVPSESEWRLPPRGLPGAQPAGFQAPVEAAPLVPQPPAAVRNQLAAAQAVDRTSPDANFAASQIGRSAASSSIDNLGPTALPQSGPYSTAIAPDSKTISSNGSPITPAPLPATGDEKFRQAEMRLRELGASHYMLETWGPENNRYRFVCKMAIGGNAGVSRYFQAIEDDPWLAMASVLHQVEQWRAQPQP